MEAIIEAFHVLLPLFSKHQVHFPDSHLGILIEEQVYDFATEFGNSKPSAISPSDFSSTVAVTSLLD